MTLQILPNWCKKIGLIIFLVSFIISGADDFMRGYKAGYNDATKRNYIEVKHEPTIFLKTFGETGIHLFEMISIFGMLIYMLSKEKIEDDFIDKLRLESYQISSAIWLTVSIIIYGFFANLKISLDYVIFLFMITYLMTFFIKKRLY